MLTPARKGSVPPHLVIIVYGVDYQGIYPVCSPHFRASASVKAQLAAFATGVPPNIYAFHRYTRNSANLYFTQDLQFQAPLPVEPIYFTPDLPARLRSLYTQ